MATVEEIKKTIISENDVFTDWRKDLEIFEDTYPYAAELAEQMLAKGGEAAFKDFANGKLSRNDLSIYVNTYPFGEKTNKIFPEFIGVCCGNQKLGRLFQVILKQLKFYMSEDYLKKGRKSITIFTDKWDPAYLKKNEALFLKAILENDVYFNFYLVTDYGITRIPFMNPEQSEKLKKIYHNEKIEEAVSLHEYLTETGLFDMVYTIEQYDSWIPSFDRINCKYEFDFETLHYEYEDANGVHKRGKVKEIYALRFLKAAVALNMAGGIPNNFTQPTNYIHKHIDFFKFSFDWYSNTIDVSNSEVQNMLDALKNMIDALN